MIWSLVRDVPASDTLVTLVSPIDNTSGSTPDGVFVDDDMDGDDVDGDDDGGGQLCWIGSNGVCKL